MTKRIYSGIILVFLCPFLISGFQKSKKAYELIYKDVQILKQQILELEEQSKQNQKYINSIKEQLDDIYELINQIRNKQASLGEEQGKIPTQYQILLEKFDAITSRLSKISEDLIEIKQSTTGPVEETEEIPRKSLKTKPSRNQLSVNQKYPKKKKSQKQNWIPTFLLRKCII